MTNVMIWNPIDRVLWGMTILLLFILAFQYLNLGKKNDNFDEKLISFGFSTVFLGVGFALIFVLLSELQITGTYINHNFYGNYENVNSLYSILYICSHTAYYSGTILFFYAFERIVKYTKYLLTITNIVIIILIIILPFNLAYFIASDIYFIINSFIIVIILMIYTKWSRLELKPITSFIFLGLLLMGLGYSLIAPEPKELNLVPLIIAPILCILGALICLVPTIVNPNSLLKNWKFAGVLVIGITCFFTFYFAFYNFPLDYIIAPLAALILIIFSIFYLHKTIKSEKIVESTGEVTDILSAISKPQKVTEEEVSVSKEKKICLVCKGKVGGTIFMCSNCGAFYCIKCSEALSNLENACWACNEVIDRSKPVKLIEEEEEKVVVEEKFNKKGNVVKDPKKL